MSTHLEPTQDEQAGNVGAAAVESKTEDRSVSPIILPEIPPTNLDLDLDLSSIIGASNPDVEKVQKRASNVQKLALENEKLKAELKAMSDRLEAAERRREELAQRERKAPPPETQA